MPTVFAVIKSTCPLFLTYINDLPSVIPYTVSNQNSSIVLLADDTSVIISEPCSVNFERKLNIVFQIMKEWFNSNLLLLNFNKTYYIQFTTKNKILNKINIEHDNKIILQTNFVKFLGITIDSTLSWKQHIDTITPKLHKTCYIIRRYKLHLSNDALKMLYYVFSIQ
jgi:protein associated with RNAse G/E